MTRRVLVGLVVVLALGLLGALGCVAVRGLDAAIAEAECGGPR